LYQPNFPSLIGYEASGTDLVEANYLRHAENDG
jgi:hypothetical protein